MYIKGGGGGVYGEAGVFVHGWMSELEVHSFPIAKQQLCLRGCHMFTEIKG